jgi:hypothetical protein
MLTSSPTKYGSGITLYGDTHDLRGLHETIHQIANERHVEERFRNFILGLAYDVRKAYEGARERKRVGLRGLNSVKYFSVNVLWPYFLPQVALIRHFAAYHPTSHRDQACLYLLEDCAITSLLACDANVGKVCSEWFLNFQMLSHDYLMQFFDHCTREFVGVAEKKRFQRLPGILRKLTWLSPEYQAYSKEIAATAKANDCGPEELSDPREFPKFRW